MRKGQLTVQSLNARVDEMSMQFQKTMDEFKLQVSQPKSPTPFATGTEDSELFSKFKSFEKNIMESMNAVKMDLCKLKTISNEIQEQIYQSKLGLNQNIILVHGIRENANNIFSEVLELFNNNLNIQVNKHQIDSCYRLGKKGPDKRRPRPVIVRFCQRWVRDEIFFNKKKLKGSAFLITELLTSSNFALFKLAKSNFGNAVWTFGGMVYVLGNDGTRKMVKTESDLNVAKGDTVAQ